MPAVYRSATRFRLSSSGAPPVSPAFDANWEQTGSGNRLVMLTGSKDGSVLTDFSRTVPITTTQDILTTQFVSAPFPVPARITGTCSMVIRDSESASTANAHLAFSLRSWNPATAVFQALASNFATQTEDPTTAATRIWSAQAITARTVAAGDRLVFEVGIHAAAPTTAQTAIRRFGMPKDIADFALTSALTTDLCPWIEIQMELLGSGSMNNQQYVQGGGGISTNERWY